MIYNHIWKMTLSSERLEVARLLISDLCIMSGFYNCLYDCTYICYMQIQSILYRWRGIQYIVPHIFSDILSFFFFRNSYRINFNLKHDCLEYIYYFIQNYVRKKNSFSIKINSALVVVITHNNVKCGIIHLNIAIQWNRMP